MISHVVAPGECLASIAEHYGFADPAVIYNHPENAALRRERPDPNVLLAGDVVAIPDRKLRELRAATEQRQRVVVKRRPVELRLRLLDDQRQPRAGLPFVVEFQDQSIRGTTDGDGVVTAAVPSWLPAATVRVSDHGTEEVFQVALGYLDPADSADGVMQRLTNLGYRCEIPGLPADVALRFTISNFQRGTGLPVTGELDDTTRQRLVEVHGS